MATITIVKSLPFVHLWFYFKNQPLIWSYEGACIGSLKGTKLPAELDAVTFDYGTYVNYTELHQPLYALYIKQLMSWGFDLKFYDYADTSSKVYGHYRVSIDQKIHMLEWFATLQVLRYTYESPDLISRWYNWTLKWPQFDPWILFMIAHRDHSGHSLISQMFTHYVNPVEVLMGLRQDIEHVLPWDCALLSPSTRLGTLFSKWGGGQDGYSSYPRVIDVEAEYKVLDAQKKGIPNADESAAARSAHPTG